MLCSQETYFRVSVGRRNVRVTIQDVDVERHSVIAKINAVAVVVAYVHVL